MHEEDYPPLHLLYVIQEELDNYHLNNNSVRSYGTSHELLSNPVYKADIGLQE